MTEASRYAVLVTGSRRWREREAIAVVLRRYPAERTVLIHGGCDGADKIAESVASELGMMVLSVPAPWEKYRRDGKIKQAGPDRNSAMVRMLRILRWTGAYSCDCHAFPLGGSVGTLNCVRKARAAKFKVTEHEPGEH